MTRDPTARAGAGPDRRDARARLLVITVHPVALLRRDQRGSDACRVGVSDVGTELPRDVRMPPDPGSRTRRDDERRADRQLGETDKHAREAVARDSSPDRDLGRKPVSDRAFDSDHHAADGEPTVDDTRRVGARRKERTDAETREEGHRMERIVQVPTERDANDSVESGEQLNGRLEWAILHQESRR